jgi:hypothetical protein
MNHAEATLKTVNRVRAFFAFLENAELRAKSHIAGMSEPGYQLTRSDKLVTVTGACVLIAMFVLPIYLISGLM